MSKLFLAALLVYWLLFYPHIKSKLVKKITNLSLFFLFLFETLAGIHKFLFHS